jgi:hypothetical protein
MRGRQGKQKSGSVRNANRRIGISQERLKSILNYDRETGVFTWKVTKGCNAISGCVAGTKRKDGRWKIKVDGIQYYSHRLAWLYEYGYLPENGLDHKDKIPHHNWIKNLREVGPVCNARNCGNPKNNKSGVKGVVYHNRDKSWEAQITVNRKQVSLGYYKDFDEAVCLRLAAEQSLNWSGCDSSSPAYKYVKAMQDRYQSSIRG